MSSKLRVLAILRSPVHGSYTVYGHIVRKYLESMWVYHNFGDTDPKGRLDIGYTSLKSNLEKLKWLVKRLPKAQVSFLRVWREPDYIGKKSSYVKQMRSWGIGQKKIKNGADSTKRALKDLFDLPIPRRRIAVAPPQPPPANRIDYGLNMTYVTGNPFDRFEP